jgi:hypothetical protein
MTPNAEHSGMGDGGFRPIAGADSPAARKCARCGHTIVPRGSAAPRYCAVCGHRLIPLADDIHYALSGTPRTPGRAIAALVLGILAFTPMCGFPLGLVAIILGLSAGERINRAPGSYTGKGLAVAGITLGIIACAIWLLVCIGLRQ